MIPSTKNVHLKNVFRWILFCKNWHYLKYFWGIVCLVKLGFFILRRECNSENVSWGIWRINIFVEWIDEQLLYHTQIYCSIHRGTPGHGWKCGTCTGLTFCFWAWLMITICDNCLILPISTQEEKKLLDVTAF